MIATFVLSIVASVFSTLLTYREEIEIADTIRPILNTTGAITGVNSLGNYIGMMIIPSTFLSIVIAVVSFISSAIFALLLRK